MPSSDSRARSGQQCDFENQAWFIAYTGWRILSIEPCDMPILQTFDTLGGMGSHAVDHDHHRPISANLYDRRGVALMGAFFWIAVSGLLFI